MRAFIHQPTPRASLTPVSSSCCSAPRSRRPPSCLPPSRPKQGIPRRANAPPRPHRCIPTRRAPQRAIALQAASPVPHTTPTVAPPLSTHCCSPRPISDRASKQRAPAPASQCPKPTRPAARHRPAQTALTSATLTTTTHTRQHHTCQQPAQHAPRRLEPTAHGRSMHRCTLGRSCVQLRAAGPADPCVGCSVGAVS